MAQMVVEEVERFIHGDAREPERELGQFDGHGIDVHAVNARFDDAPPPVGDLRFLLRKTGGHGDIASGENVGLGALALATAHDALGFPPRARVGEDVPGEILDGADEEVSAAHRGIDDIQREHAEGEGVVAAILDGLGLE